MELEQIIEERYSVRKYKETPVEKEKIDAVLQAGMKAPTGKNHQPQRIYVIQTPQGMEKLKTVCPCTFGAPMAMLICYNEEECWHSRFEEGYNCGEMDVSIVTTYMMLKAWELGIGSCWVRYFDAREVAKAFGLPGHVIPACVLDLGYAADDCEPLKTMHNCPRPMEEIVTHM